MRIDLDTTDYDVKMAMFRVNLPAFPTKAVKGATDIIEKNMILVIPVKTGKLRDSVKKSVIGNKGIVETTSGYGLYVDEDTKPHRIDSVVPIRDSGGIKFRFIGMHPGTTGQQFRRKTLDNSQQEIMGEILRIYDQQVVK